MIARIVLAVVVAIVVGLLLSALLGPILLTLGVPIATIVGDFFVRWGWALGVLAGLWFFFASYGAGWTWPWPWRSGRP
jgi:uncharacterized membrane protein YvlD (DUF360 family)